MRYWHKKDLQDELNEPCDVDDDDENIEDHNDVEFDDDDDDDDEVRINENLRHGDDDNDDDIAVDSASSEPESVAALRLKLALAQAERENINAQRENINAQRELNERSWQIEQERMRRRETNNEMNVRSNECSSGFAEARDVAKMLPKMEGDVLAFFVSFEKIMILHGVQQQFWAKYLPAQLNQRALRVFTRLSLEDSQLYEKIKDAILADFNLGAAEYLKMFRSMRRTGSCNYATHLSNLREIFSRYIQASNVTEFPQLFDLMLKEQFENRLSPNVKAFVLSREPVTSEDAARAADLCFQVNRVSAEGNSHVRPGNQFRGPQNTSLNTRPRFANPRPMFNPGMRSQIQGRSGGGNNGNNANYQRGVRANANPYIPPHNGVPRNSANQTYGRNVRPAFFVHGDQSLNDCDAFCDRNVHSINQDRTTECDDCDDDLSDCCVNEYVVPTYVNDMKTSALRDTGNNAGVIVDQSLVRPSQIVPGVYKNLQGIFDANKFHRVRVANITIRSPHFGCDQNLELQAAVSNLPAGLTCIIGNEFFRQFPHLQDIISVKPRTTKGHCTTISSKSNKVTSQQLEVDAQDNPDTPANKADIPQTKSENAINTAVNVITRAQASRGKIVEQPCSAVAGSNRPTDKRKTDNDMSITPSDTNGLGLMTTMIGTGSEHGQTPEPNRTADISISHRSTSDTNKPTTDMSGTGTQDDGSDTLDRGVDNRATPSERNENEDSFEAAASAIRQIDISENDYINGETDTESQTEFKRAQKTDPGLRHLWQLLEKGNGQVVIRNGLLHRKIPAHISTTHDLALVVPGSYEHYVIRAAHNSQGHFGVRKCVQKIEQLFFFPKMRQKIKQYIKSCHQCQMVRPIRKKDRAPLQPIQVLSGEPFQEITMDILGGQWPVTKRKNKYMLVTICNLSRWVNISPLKNLKATTIADVLIEQWSWTGIPKIIRSDNMASFHSELLDALRNKLGIEPKFSAPLHFESHGSVERVQGTIEMIIRKLVQENPKSWDQLLPYVLFSLREVPNSATGYSAAELVYGRKFRGLLTILRESWTGHDQMFEYKNMSTAQYMTELNDRIQATLKAAEQNVAKAQVKMKRAYDKHASIRTLNPGDLALLLVPTSDNKIFCQWSGPFRVIRRCENNNYELQLENRKAMFHINSLQKYYTPD